MNELHRPTEIMSPGQLACPGCGLALTLLADGIRSVFIEGAGFSEISAPAVILTAIGIFFFSIGLKMFKWH